MMRETILIRHAETYYNKSETDDLDSALTELGLQQAVGLSCYLRESEEAEGFVGLVSPFKRTLNTAAIIQNHTGTQFKVFPLICEYGATWGKKPHHVYVPNRQNEYPEFDWSLYQQGQLFTAETFVQFLDRMRKILAYDLPEKTLIVSHGAVVYTLTDLLIGGWDSLEDGYNQVTNASVSKIYGSKPDYLFKNDWKEGLT